MATRKDMRDTKGVKPNPSFFRVVVNNGDSKGLNLSRYLKNWTQVRITILEDTDKALTLIIEDVESLR